MPGHCAGGKGWRCNLTFEWLISLGLLSALTCTNSLTVPEPSGRKDVLLWQVQLTPDQCSIGKTPCWNIYAVNQTQGDLLWYAYTTSSSGVKAMSVGRHSVYYTTWSGPGLYTVNAASGHVRWQFPLDNWFRYWIKDIDLPASASFSHVEEVKDLVYAAAAGPPSRLYGLKAKSGIKQWEYKCPDTSAVLADIAGPSPSRNSRSKIVFLAYNAQSSNSSWLQALDLSKGVSLWRSEAMHNVQLDNLEMLDADRLLATSASGDLLLSFNSSTGQVLWEQQVQFCGTPSPIAEVHAGQLWLPRSCSNLQDLSVLDAYTGEVVWESWQVPVDAEPTGNCTWIAARDSSMLFGCRCNSTIKGDLDQQLHQARKALEQEGGTDSRDSSTGDSRYADLQAPDVAMHPTEQAVCMYAVSTHSGKLRWVQAIPGDTTFPAEAQTWGMAPILHHRSATFTAADRLLTLDTSSGKVVWTYELPAGDSLTPWQLPVLDAVNDILILTAQRANKTAVTALGATTGKWLWMKTVNGTAQLPQGPTAGARQLWLSGGNVYIEACKVRTCCLRAFNVTAGQQRWGMCLQAEQGEDATHPHAQFAIWVITVVTIGSIGLLIVGACLLYVHRWSEERRILHGFHEDGSPRHSYRPLPDRAGASDSD